jgi:hypothetical protein
VEDLVEQKEPLGKEEQKALPGVPDKPSIAAEEKTAVKPEPVPEEKIAALPEKEPSEEAASEPPKKQAPALSPDTGPAPLFLRNRPRDLTTEDVRSMLHRYRFYATCWNYNGDFCNPEGDFPNRLLDNKDGTVSDQATGLMWMKGGSPSPLSWADGRAFVAQLNGEKFAGHSDWRMPTLEELASLMENAWKNRDLFIDPLFDRAQRYCWSSDTQGMSKAWKANFHLGFFIDFPMTTNNSVRPVRSFTVH